MGDTHGHGKPRPLSKLIALVRPDKADLGIVLAFSVAVGVLTLAVPLAAQTLFNYVAFGTLTQPLIVLGGLLLAVLVFSAVLRAITALVVEILQRRWFVRIVAELGDRLVRVRADAFDKAYGPEIVNRYFDIMTVQKAGATLLLDSTGAVLQTLVGLTIVAFYHPALLIFAVVLLLAMNVVVFALSHTAVRTAIRESDAKYSVAAALEEIVRNRLAFKQVDGHGLAFRHADECAQRYVQARRAHFGVVFRQLIGALAVQSLAATLLLTLGGLLVIRQELTLGQLVASELIVTLSLASFVKVAMKLGQVYDMFAAVYKVSTLLELPTERTDGEAHASRKDGASLVLAGVGFAYPGGRPVLEDVNLRLRPGERVAIVGGYGTGKSTLSDLVFASRTPTAGRIEIDGVELRELRVGSIRRHVALVRGIEIISGTIEENVRMGRPDATAADCRKALERVGLLDELRALPEGLATALTGEGAPLSRGQQQLLMLARALAGEPRLLVIEDILDDMDAQARERVMSMLSAADVRATVLLLDRDAWVAPYVDRVLYAVRGRGPVEPADRGWTEEARR